MKLIHAQIAECQRELDQTKKDLRAAIGDLDMDDEIIIQLRKQLQVQLRRLRELDFKALKR